MSGALDAPAPVELLDARTAWAALTPEQQTEIGVAAIAASLGKLGMEQSLAPFVTWDAADIEGGLALEDAVREHVVGDRMCLPRPDLAAIGIRSCVTCGCTDTRACEPVCEWVGDSLCSSCVPFAPAVGS